MHDDYSLSRNLIYCLCYWYKQQTCQQGQMTRKQAAGTSLQCMPAGPRFPRATISALFQIEGLKESSTVHGLPAKLTSGRGQFHLWVAAVTFILYLLILTLPIGSLSILWNGWVHPWTCPKFIPAGLHGSPYFLVTYHSFGIPILRSSIVAENRGLITCITVYSLGNVSLFLPPSLSLSPVYSL